MWSILILDNIIKLLYKYSMTHEEKYLNLYYQLSVNDIATIMGMVYMYVAEKYKLVTDDELIGKLIELHKKDEHLNNIPLDNWDRWTMSMYLSLPKGLSLGEKVSLLKFVTVRNLGGGEKNAASSR